MPRRSKEALLAASHGIRVAMPFYSHAQEFFLGSRSSGARSLTRGDDPALKGEDLKPRAGGEGAPKTARGK